MSLFRGKRVGERQWKYGSYVEQYGATQIYLKMERTRTDLTVITLNPKP